MCIRFGKQITYTPKQTSEYEKLIKASYMAVSRTFFEKDVPLEINILAFFSGKYSDSSWMTKKPDADNIIKIILDGLNKVAFYDDAQVCKLYFEKRYAKIPRVEITIKNLKEKNQ
jgi:Holliday junction resolvase RusA-like endonuclease